MAPLRSIGGAPIELYPGGGDLRRSSVPVNEYLRGTTDLWNRTISHREIWRTQPIAGSLVDKIVRQISRLPLKIYQPGSQAGSKKRVHGNDMRLRGGDAASLLREPAPGVAPISWKEHLLLPTAVEGNGLLRKIREDPIKPPIGLRRVDWRLASPEFTEDGAPPTAWWLGDRFKRTVERVPATEVVHMAWASFECGVGISPFEHLGTTLRIEDAAQNWQIANLSNASRPPGVVTLDDKFLGWDKGERQVLLDQATSQVRSVYTGPDNAGKPLVLPPGMTWNDAGFSAHEAELIDQRKLAREEMCVVFDVPEVMLGLMENATLSNVEVWARLLFTHVLGPWIVLFEETIQAQLLDAEPAWGGLFVEFELAEVLRGDTLKEITALRLAVMAGLMTINEARATRNLPRLDFPYCDEPLIPANNMRPISQAGEPQSGTASGSDGSSGQSEDNQLASAAITNFLTAADNDSAREGERLLAGAIS